MSTAKELTQKIDNVKEAIGLGSMDEAEVVGTTNKEDGVKNMLSKHNVDYDDTEKKGNMTHFMKGGKVVAKWDGTSGAVTVM